MSSSFLPAFRSPFQSPVVGPWGGGGQRLPAGYLALWDADGVDSIGLLTKFIDRVATGTHEAFGAKSLRLDGTQVISLASTIYLVGDFTLSFRLKHHTVGAGVIFGNDYVPPNAQSFLYFNSSDNLLLQIQGVVYTFSAIPRGRGSYSVIRVGPNITITTESETETIECSALDFAITFIGSNGTAGGDNKLTNADIYDIYAEDSTGVKLDNTLAQGAGTLLASTVGPDITATNTSWVTSALYGHDWNGFAGYMVADGEGDYDDGAILPAIFYGSESGTLYTGSARRNIAVKGWANNFAGPATISLAHLTGSETVDASVGTSTPTVSAGLISFSAGWCSRVVLSDGTDLIIESSYDSEQTTIYNIDGTGRHGTLSAVNWTANTNSSYLSQNGGRIAGGNLIQWSEDATTLALTNGSGSAILVGKTASLVDSTDIVKLGSFPAASGVVYALSVLVSPTTPRNTFVRVGLDDGGTAKYQDMPIPESGRLDYIVAATGTSATASFYISGISGGVADNPPVMVSVDQWQAVVYNSDYPAINSFVCLGDSLTMLDGITHYLPVVMDSETYVFNHGVSGESLAEFDARIDTVISSRNPSHMAILGGGNDLLQGRTVAQMQASMTSMLAKADAANVEVILVEPPPFGTYAQWSEVIRGKYDEYRAWLAVQPCLYFVPTFDHFAEAGTYNLQSGMTDDGLHPLEPALRGLGALAIAPLVEYQGYTKTTGGLAGIGDIIPRGATTQARTFDSPLDAPSDIFVLNAIADPGIVAADDTNIFISALGAVNAVDPFDMQANTGDKIFKGPSAMLMYSTALTGSKIAKAENYVD